MSTGLKYITRIDCDSRHAYRVRISHLNLRRNFADSLCGGKERALALAVEFRDRALKAAGLPLTDRQIRTRSERNTTGVIGVTRSERKRYFRVAAIGRGKAVCVAFGDNEQAALRRAAQIRRQMEVKAYGATIALNWSKTLAVLNGEGR